MSSTCKDLETRIMDFLEGTLPPLERQLLEAHLADCASCRERIEGHKAAWDALDVLDEQEATPFFVAGTMKKMRTFKADRKKTGIRKLVLALAACIVLAASLVFYFNSAPSLQTGVVETDLFLVSEAEIIEELDLMEDLDFLVEYGDNLELAMEYDLYQVLGEEETF